MENVPQLAFPPNTVTLIIRDVAFPRIPFLTENFNTLWLLNCGPWRVHVQTTRIRLTDNANGNGSPNTGQCSVTF